MKAVRSPGLAAKLFADDVDGVDPYSTIERGQFEIVTEPSGQQRFWFVCPGACKTLAALALRPVADGSAQSWGYDGNEEAPTLSPSINHVGCWHGHLINGIFTSC